MYLFLWGGDTLLCDNVHHIYVHTCAGLAQPYVLFLRHIHLVLRQGILPACSSLSELDLMANESQAI